MSINWPAPCWLHHMERSGCNSWDRPGHSARELEGQAAGDILICAAMCKGMHLQSGSVPVIRLPSIFSENGRKTRKKESDARREEVLAEADDQLASCICRSQISGALKKGEKNNRRNNIVG